MDEDIKIFWGDTLTPIALDTRIKALLPYATALFLQTVGLPSSKLIFEARRNLVIHSFPPQLMSITQKFEGGADGVAKTGCYCDFIFVLYSFTLNEQPFLYIGKTHDSLIIIDEKTGWVYSVWDKFLEIITANTSINLNISEKLTFVNTSIQNFLRCIQAEIDYYKNVTPFLREYFFSYEIPPDQRNVDKIDGAISKVEYWVNRLRNEILSIDPIALQEKPLNWWARRILDISVLYL